MLADLSGVKPAPGPTDLAAARRHYAAQITQRGPLMLISDLFDANAERAISELAGTRCDVAVLHTLSPDELDPPLEGDLRLVDRETGDGVNVTADLSTLDAYKARLVGVAGAARRGRQPSAASPTCQPRPRCRWPTSSSPSCGAGTSWRPSASHGQRWDSWRRSR